MHRLIRFFKHEHLPAYLQPAAHVCAGVADWIVHNIPDGPERTAGLRKLLEAKDCFVRAVLEGMDSRNNDEVGK